MMGIHSVGRYLFVTPVSRALLVAAALLLATPLAASVNVQKVDNSVARVLLNTDWSYYEAATTEPGEVEAAVTPTTVHLPHTWNRTDPVDQVPGYRRDASWYRKRLELLPGGDSHRYKLYFEAANMTASVYVNGIHVGGHVGGYLGFEIDISEAIHAPGVNDILVRVDNAVDRSLIPSQKSDFVLYGGLTRDVYLHILPQDHVAAVQIDTPVVTREAAQVKATVHVERHGENTGARELSLRVIDSRGETVASAQQELGQGPGASVHEVRLPQIGNPALWSPDAPRLYTLSARLLSAEGKVLHEVSETLGLRWFEFAADGSFMLNGQRLLLRGTHRHEEHAGYGAAIPNELHLRDMEQIKEIGANFVRLGHYPQDPAIYRAADRLGLIIWDELPWCRGGLGDAAWKRNTESMLREMITQNRNHPSVFFWSLGNEMYWLPDYEGGDDEAAMNDYLRHLNDIAHEMDPSRLTAVRKYYAGWDIVDVFSPSIWAGWYGGGYHQYESALLEAQDKYPRVLHMEYGGSSHVGRHDWTPVGGDGMAGGQVSVTEMVNQSGVRSVAKAGDWSESYIVDLFDWHLRVSESLAGFGGNAQWAFKDFATPLRPENAIPYINQKGLVDREGRPKEAYWVFRSHWSTDPAFCHIYGHSWTERLIEPGSTQRIRVYCNTETAQLALNGAWLKEKQRDAAIFPAAGLFWDVPLREGANRLEVVGRSGGEQVASDALEISVSVEPHGKAAGIRLRAYPGEDGRIHVEAVVVDDDGRRVHSARERIYFSHTNPGSGGRLIQDHGTPDKSAVIELANGRAEILFDPLGGGTGAVIEARTQNLKGSWIRLP